MEIRDWAIGILSADTIEGKLFVPDQLTDNIPGPALLWDEPTRPVGLGFKRKTKEEKLPPFHEHHHLDKRAACIHRFAGHELLAVEVMAYTLLAFPEASPRFRKGVANTLREEQGHVRLYMQRMEAMNLKFGEFPLYKYFWTHTPQIKSPLHYVTTMSLTFEMANLDFSTMYGESFARNGDTESAALMAKILEDEISHVSFGWNWLCKLQDERQTPWESWSETLATTRLTPKRARGFVIHEAPRLAAGISDDWLLQFKASQIGKSE
jgi:uncharacterized ferritin-like protein (DUF455 family)